MGACGCGDTVPDVQLPGPDGITYAIQVYPSCHYCHTPVAVDIYRFGPDSAAEWTDGVPELVFQPYSAENPVDAQVSIPVLDSAALAAELSDPEQGYEVDVDEQSLRHALPSAVWRTRNDWAIANNTPAQD